MSQEVHCVLCSLRGIQRELEEGHCCERCRSWLHNTVIDIGFLASEAASYEPPATTGGFTSIAYGSKPPLDIERIDPELSLIKLIPGDESSTVTILDMLEMWERAIREDRGYTKYGPASSQRAMAKRVRLADTQATLIGCVDFLAGQVDWIVSEPNFGLEEFADQIRRAASILRRWSSEQIGTRIACPGMVEDRPCGNQIRISSEGEEVTCRKCGHPWTIEWLIMVAGEDADGWADIEAVSKLSGLHERTIRRWARAGKVRKRGQLYNVRDVSEAANKAATA